MIHAKRKACPRRPITSCALGIILAVGSGWAARAAERPEVSVSAGWDSVYVSEGRDTIGDGGLFSASADLSWGRLSFGGWAARGASADYREYNLVVGYALQLGPVAASAGYTRLEYGGIGEAPGDNEFSLELALPLGPQFECLLCGRHSTEARGTFVEAVVRRPWETPLRGVTLTPYVLLGLDFGYATRAYDGPNHLQAGIAIDYAVANNVTCSCYCARCWAAGDVRREGGPHITWGGVRMSLQM